MGTTWSRLGGEPPPPPPLPPPPQIAADVDSERKRRREEELEKLKEDLSKKRELRRAKLGQVGEELKTLREQLEAERLRRMELEEEVSRVRGKKTNLLEGCPVTGQGVTDIESNRQGKVFEDVEEEEDKVFGTGTKIDRSQDEIGGEVKGNQWEEEKKRLEEGLAGQQERGDRLEQQVRALKDVANIGKELLTIRELQVEELNKKLKMIEETGVEYEKEVESMRRLRGLYEERARATLAEHRVQLERERARLDVANTRLRLSQQDNRDLTEQNEEISKKAKQLDSQLDAAKAELSETKVELATKSEQLYHASNHLTLINNLFSQIIAGPEVDLDRLAAFLEENHSLINQITAKGDVKSVASLAQLAGIEMEPPEGSKEVAQNLTKVWRVLTELLSHHKRGPEPTEWDSCYKSVETPQGPKVVISVSQTFIKLKDLILEKNSLVKEVGRLRKLNGHLEVRMEEQEKRLTLVTEELCSTWAVVNKLKTQHDNLHTNEKILRYELQHKRNMLNDLKKQLEICRQQWACAREKNNHAERDWKKLRAEFAQRKRAQFSSVESGYEDDETPPEEDTDEDKSAELLNSPAILSDQEGDEPTKSDTQTNLKLPQDGLGAEHGNPENGQLQNTDIKSDTERIPCVPENDSLEDAPDIKSDTERIPCVPENDSLEDAPDIKTDTERIPCVPEHDSLEDAPNIKSDTERIPWVPENDSLEGPTDTKNDTGRIPCIPENDLLGDAPDISNTERIPSVPEKTADQEVFNSASSIAETDSKESMYFKPEQSVDVKHSSVTEPNCHNAEKVLPSSLESEPASELAMQRLQPTESVEDPKLPLDSLAEGQKEPTTDDVLKRREERLKRMEESCKSLFARMGQTSSRSDEISTKLDQIHAQYGPENRQSPDKITDQGASSQNTSEDSTE